MVRRGTPFIDLHALSDGVVHILGVEWPEDLQPLAQIFVDHRIEAGENLAFVRLVAVHEGFGLIAFAETTADRVSVDMDRVAARLAGLEWRAQT